MLPFPTASELYLTLEGVTDDWIRINDLSIGVSNSGTAAIGGGAGSGTSSVTDLTFSTTLGTIDPILRQFAALGTHSEGGQIEFWDAGRQNFLGEVRFDTSIVSSHKMADPLGQGGTPQVTFSLASSTLIWGFAEEGDKTSKDIQGYGFDFQKNVEIIDPDIRPDSTDAALRVTETLPDNVRWFIDTDGGGATHSAQEIDEVALTITQSGPVLGGGGGSGKASFGNLAFSIGAGPLAAELMALSTTGRHTSKIEIFATTADGETVLDEYELTNVLVTSAALEVQIGKPLTYDITLDYAKIEEVLTLGTTEIEFGFDVQENKATLSAGSVAGNVFSSDDDDALFGGSLLLQRPDNDGLNILLATSPATDDSAASGYGDDLIGGGDGNDTLDGGDDNDALHGEAGHDNLLGGSGDDTLSGGVGNDTLSGGSGDDLLDGGPGADVIAGGAGLDTADYTASTGGITLRLNGSAGSGGDANGDVLSEIEGILGSLSDDDLTGNTADNLLAGNDGKDTLVGATGNDTLDGGDGADSLRGNGGDDSIDAGSGNDRVSGDEGNDTVHGGDGNDRILGGNDNDEMDGGAGNDSVFGQSGADTLYGGDGNDTVAGNRGADELHGGDGNDRLLGNESRDVLYGEDGNDVLNGGSGIDTLFGGDGEDTLNGGAGSDSLTGGTGSDVFVFANSGGIDRVTDFENGLDVLDFSASGLTFSTLSITAYGGGAGTRLQGAGHTIFLEGIDISLIDASDFV